MRISRAVDYAVRCVHYMSMRPAGTVCILTDICRDQDVPVSFMAKILQGLSKAGIVRSIRGSKRWIRFAQTIPGISRSRM